MSKLLINEYPLQALPSLAVAIGLNEAIMLQQVHYWLNHAKKEHDGQMWFYKSYEDWQKQDFPFWSITTIRRVAKSLKDKDLLLSEQLADNSFDRRNYYSINRSELAKIEAIITSKPYKSDMSNMDTSQCPKDALQVSNMDTSDMSNMDTYLREQKDLNKESAHSQKIEGDVLQTREDNADSITNWQPPSKKQMQDMVFMAGHRLEITDGQYQSHLDDFKAFYEEAAANGKPIKRENLRQAKLKGWLINVAQRQPKQDAETANRPHDNRSDSFSQTDAPKLTREQQLEKNRQAMIAAGVIK